MSGALQPGSTLDFVQPRHTRIRLIGIGGLLQAGKDAVADYLVEKHGWVKMGMSDPLDQALRAQNPFIQILPGEPLNYNKGPKYLRYQDIRDKISYVEAKTITDVRTNLQTLGTEVGRNLLGEDTWVQVARDNINDRLIEGKSVILTGVRYPNELALINQFVDAGQTWFVTRPGKREPKKTDQHSSETSVSAQDFSVVIDNNGTLEDLYRSVDVVLFGE